MGKKGQQILFGYKGHILVDTDYHLIRKIETTTASLHDSQVDLGINGLPRYADKGYSGSKTQGYDAAMKKAARGHKLGIKDILRNKRISRTRSHIERCFAVMKRSHNAGHVSHIPQFTPLHNTFCTHYLIIPEWLSGDRLDV